MGRYTASNIAVVMTVVDTVLPAITELKNKLEQDSGVVWTLPSDLSRGVLSTSGAFELAKKLGVTPVAAAHSVAASLSHFPGTTLSQTGPYLNIQLDMHSLQAVLENNIFGTGTAGVKKSEKILFEYVSPNVAKPLHAGHLRNIVVGESILRLLKTQYQTVISDNHWGDWGVQFGVLLWAIEAVQGRESELTVILNDTIVPLKTTTDSKIEYYVKLYVWANQQKDIVPEWDAQVRHYFALLERGDADSRMRWREIVGDSQAEIVEQLTALGVTPHDLNQGESFYEGEMVALGEFLEKNSLWSQDGQGRFIDFYAMQSSLMDERTQKRLAALAPTGENTSEHQLGRGYLRSTQGYTTYLFRDVAARIQWARDLQADEMITVVDHTQNHHLAQVFVVCAYLSQQSVFIAEYGVEVAGRLGGEHLKNIGYGFITLPSGKMSTRKGNFLTATEIIQPIFEKAKEKLSATVGTEIAQQVALAAIKWADLSKDWVSDAVFDAEKMLQFEGNTGVYQLYTIARLKSIGRKNKSESTVCDVASLNAVEREILASIYTFDMVVTQAAMVMKPHQICNYLYALTTKINSWYAQFQVSSELDPVRKQTLLLLCARVADHLVSGLSLLGIEAVDEL
jgi:arginyl-tRNA synthetase